MKGLSSLIVIFSLILAGMLSASFILAVEKIDINAAPLEDLVKIIHIGEVRAQELISLRPFSSLDDLARINGISEKRVEDIKKQDLAYINTQEEPEPKPAQEPEPETSSTSTKKLLEASPPSIIYPSNVVINEILPSPTGPDSEEEWIEILNGNSFNISLFDWQIVDVTGKTTSYIFPKETTMSPNGFFVLWRPVSKITLNNSGDGLKLIQPDGNIADTVNYEKAKQGESFNRIGSKWAWGDTLTPGALNIAQVPEPKKEAPESEATGPVPYEKGLASVREQASQDGPAPSFVLLIAIPIAVFSGIIILTLKKKLKIGYNKKI